MRAQKSNKRWISAVNYRAECSWVDAYNISTEEFYTSVYLLFLGMMHSSCYVAFLTLNSWSSSLNLQDAGIRDWIVGMRVMSLALHEEQLLAIMV